MTVATSKPLRPPGVRPPRLPPRTWIIAVTVVSLGIATAASIVWFVRADGIGRLEPAVQSLGLLAGVTGIVLERWAATAERRDQALEAIGGELAINEAILNRRPFAKDSTTSRWRGVYPRLHISAVDAALSSAALVRRRDGRSLDDLHTWRDQVRMFNDKLTMAEILMFTNGTDQVLADLQEGLHAPDGPLDRLREQLDRLRRRITGSAEDAQRQPEPHGEALG